MRLGTALLSFFICIFLLPTLAFGAEAPTPLFLNGKELKPEVSPKIIKGNTMVPIRIIAEELGAKVTWDGVNRKVMVNSANLQIQLTIDKLEAMAGGKNTTLEVAPILVNGSTLLPLRFIGEQLGVKFTWDDLTHSVFMFKKSEGAGDKKPIDIPVLSPADNVLSNGTSPEAEKPKDPVPTKPSTSLPMVKSIETLDKQLVIKWDNGDLQPNVFKLSNPDRIVFDLPNAALDSSLKSLLAGTFRELPSQNPLIEKIRFSLFTNEPSTVRIILDLKQKADITLIPSKLPNQMIAEVKPITFKVVIDAGHGDHDSGAVSITNKYEKDFTLSMAKKVNKILANEPKIQTYLTRTDDTFVELNDRVAFANEKKADLFVSIHGNKYKSSISGVETYYSRDESIDFANLIHKHTVKATGFPDRNVRQADYRVIKYTTMPAALVEVGYLSNKDDEAAMFTDAFQDRVAASLVSAIKEYLNIN